MIKHMYHKISRRNIEGFLAKYASDKKTLNIGAGEVSYRRFFTNLTTVDVDAALKPDVVADAHHLPFEDEAFDIIISTEVLEHLKDLSQAIGEMKRVLKKGGLLILTTRFISPIHDSPNDYWRFTKYGLKELFKDWDIIELKADTGNFTTIGSLIQRLGFQTRLRLNKIIKFILYLLAGLFTHLDFLVLKEYGDIRKSVEEKNIMPGGYYLAAKK